MTTDTQTPARRRTLSAPLAATGAAAVAWAGTALALAQASGVTHLGRDSYDTEFIEATTYDLAALAAVLLAGLAARRSWRLAVGGLAVAVAGLVWGGTVTVDRYADSGWGDGLEVVVYLVPLGAAVVGLAAIAVIARLSRRRDA